MTVENDDRIEQLTETVSQLTEYVQLLINAVDELREEIGQARTPPASPQVCSSDL